MLFIFPDLLFSIITGALSLVMLFRVRGVYEDSRPFVRPYQACHAIGASCNNTVPSNTTPFSGFSLCPYTSQLLTPHWNSQEEDSRFDVCIYIYIYIYIYHSTVAVKQERYGSWLTEEISNAEVFRDDYEAFSRDRILQAVKFSSV
jgi:hypothetical protein